MDLTVCAETVFADLTLVERMAAIRKVGISGVELWGIPPERVAEVERALRVSGCRLENFSGNRNHSLIDEQERESFLAELQGQIALAKSLGCPRVMLLSDRLDNRGIAIPPARSIAEAQRFTNLVEGLKAAAELAESADIMLVVEPLNTHVDHAGYTLAHSEPAFETIRQIGSPWLKVLYDVYHMQIMEGNLIATMESNLVEIGHIHVADVPGRHEPGTGEINYVNIARMLRANGYTGSVGLECFPLNESQNAISAFATVFQP